MSRVMARRLRLESGRRMYRSLVDRFFEDMQLL